MNTADLSRSRFYRSTLLACFCLLFGVACAAKSGKLDVEFVNNEETFVFAGTCFNGEPYRLFLYQKNIAGLSQSHYDYDGPVGKGTVQSDTSPKVMAARVCRKYAEIINAKYWE